MKVPKSLETPFNPILINRDTNDANIVDKMAKSRPYLDVLSCFACFSTMNRVPKNINNIDKSSIMIVTKSPCFVVSSKKKIINKIVVNMNPDLSMGMT